MDSTKLYHHAHIHRHSIDWRDAGFLCSLIDAPSPHRAGETSIGKHSFSPSHTQLGNDMRWQVTTNITQNMAQINRAKTQVLTEGGTIR